MRATAGVAIPVSAPPTMSTRAMLVRNTHHRPIGRRRSRPTPIPAGRNIAGRRASDTVAWDAAYARTHNASPEIRTVRGLAPHGTIGPSAPVGGGRNPVGVPIPFTPKVFIVTPRRSRLGDVVGKRHVRLRGMDGPSRSVRRPLASSTRYDGRYAIKRSALPSDSRASSPHKARSAARLASAVRTSLLDASPKSRPDRSRAEPRSSARSAGA